MWRSWRGRWFWDNICLRYNLSGGVTLKSKDLEGEWSAEKDVLYGYKIRYRELINNVLG